MLTFSIHHISSHSRCFPVLLSSQRRARPTADFLEAPSGTSADRVASVLLIFYDLYHGYFATFVIVLEMSLSFHVNKYQAYRIT